MKTFIKALLKNTNIHQTLTKQKMPNHQSSLPPGKVMTLCGFLEQALPLVAMTDLFLLLGCLFTFICPTM